MSKPVFNSRGSSDIFLTRDMKHRVVVVVAVCLVMGGGFFLRVSSLSNWLDHKERYFFHDQQIPLMLTVDSYYYLELARQLQEGTFSDVDERRHVPVGYKQPSTPPLLSVLLAGIGRITGASLEWVALLLPAFLGIVLAIPVYLLCYTLAIKARGGGVDDRLRQGYARVAGLAAAVLALLSPLFLWRSSVGWCDTDALNVVFPVLLTYLAVRCADAEHLKGRVVWLAGFIVTTLLFLWWWDQSHVPVFAFTAIPFGVALVFVGIRTPKKLLPFIVVGAGLLLLIGWWKGFGLLNPLNYLDNLKGMTRYIISETGASPFRPAGEAVSEQSRASLEILMRESSGGWPGFVLACCGLLVFAWLTRGYIFYLTPLIIVSILSLWGQRFLIFTAPLFGLGVGALCFLICCLIKKPVWKTVVLFLLLLLASWSAVNIVGLSDKRVPRRLPVLFEAMKEIAEKTEEDAVIWASWGHGHPLLYYGQRGVVADGIFHNAELQYVLSFPLACDDFRLAANWISFYVAHGAQGLRKANKLFGAHEQDWVKGMKALQGFLTVGVHGSRKIFRSQYHLAPGEIEENLQWLFPETQRPVYLFLDYLLLNQAWFTLGRWDLASRSGPGKMVFVPLRRVADNEEGKIEGISEIGKVSIDVNSGQLQTGGRTVSLGVLKIHDGKKVNATSYTSHSKLLAEVFLPGRIGVLADQQTANTILVKLYYEYTYNRRFFSPIDVGRPHYGIWKVSGERYRPTF